MVEEAGEPLVRDEEGCTCGRSDAVGLRVPGTQPDPWPRHFAQLVVCSAANPRPP
jgi:hypothetical protein